MGRNDDRHFLDEGGTMLSNGWDEGSAVVLILIVVATITAILRVLGTRKNDENLD